MTDILNQALDNPIFPAIGMAVAATVGALWVAAAWWAYRDASWRTGSGFLGMLAAGWIVVSTPLMLPLALGVYTLARPQHTSAEGRSRRLIEELVAQLHPDSEETGICRACGASVEVEWLRCPTCAAWLAQPCAHCGGWSDPGLEICPWCGNEDRAEPVVEELQPAPVFNAKRRPRRRQVLRQSVGVVALDPHRPRARLDVLLDWRPPARAGSR